MKKKLLLLLLILPINILTTFSQNPSDIEIYMLTCHPGNEVYSLYGHSALRIKDRSSGSDMVYNWGVFDFNTTHFVWKFAKGKLNYSLGVYPYDNFLREYVSEKRSVYSQRVFLLPEEMVLLFNLIGENMKEENRNYRYDFFYDDCSTRIRDILEKSTKNRLIYPPDNSRIPTFRYLINEYQKVMPWLNASINLVIGTPGDKKAHLRDRMFLPLDLQTGLTYAKINRDGKMMPILGAPEPVLEFDPPAFKKRFYSEPVFVLMLVFILVLALSVILKTRQSIKTLDLMIFLFFSILALLMIFFNFITNHDQTKWNLNFIWLNPFILFCFVSLLINKPGELWFSIVFVMAALSLVMVFVFHQLYDHAFIPVILILMLRSAVRAGYSWVPFPSE